MTHATAHRYLRGVTLVLLSALPLAATAQSIDGFSVPVPDAPIQASSEEIQRLILRVNMFWSSKGDQSAAIQSKLNQLGGATGVTLTYVRTMAGGEWLVELQHALNRAQAVDLAEDLKAVDSSVVFVQPDSIIFGYAVPNDPRFLEQWHYQAPTGSNRSGVDLPTAWNTTRGYGAVVAVLDSGYRPHADLAGNIKSGGYDFVSLYDYDQTIGRDSDPTDPLGTAPNGGPGGGCPRPCIWPDASTPWHGTHVAGTVAAVSNNGVGVAGVAYEAKILPVRVLGPSAGSLSDLVDAIRWTAGSSVGATATSPALPSSPTPRAQIINMSLGALNPGACPQPLSDAINYAVSRNVTVIAAAGNQGTSANFFPGNCANVIAVAALAKNGSRASYSNYGSNISISAPGGEGGGSDAVLSTYNTGTILPVADSYGKISGTSMATPHVSGVAALIKSLRPNFTPAQVLGVLQASARPFVSSSCNPSICGAGMLDASRALALLNQSSNIALKSGLSGTWYNTAMPGQGFFVDVDAAQSYVFLGWYTHDVNGQPGTHTNQLRWYTIQDTYVTGESVKTMPIYLNVGGNFNAQPPTSPTVVGSATVSFQSCNLGTLQYSMTADGQPVSGTIPLTRLTQDQYCDTGTAPNFSLSNAGINPSLGGAWYDVATPGQGFQFNFSPLDNNFAFLAWYTYDLNGQGAPGASGQRWYTIQHNYMAGVPWLNAMPIYQTTGGRFDVHPPVTTTLPIGYANLYVVDCNHASFTYNITGRPVRTINLSRLLGGSNCRP